MLTPGDKMYAFIMPFSPARDRCTEAAEWLENKKEEKKETQQPQEVTPTKGPHKDSSASVQPCLPQVWKWLFPSSQPPPSPTHITSSGNGDAQCILSHIHERGPLSSFIFLE